MKQWKVGIFLFNEVEVLDFAGPYEVFAITAYPGLNIKPFEVKTVAQTSKIIKARNGLQIMPDCCFADNPCFDILIIPGGYGAEEVEIYNDTVLCWIQDQRSKVSLMASVCTGALLLAKAGLLQGKKATTHWMDIDRLATGFNVDVQRGVKYVDEGSVMTSGGISAGINMSLYIIKKLLGEEVALTTAKRMEYDIDFQ